MINHILSLPMMFCFQHGRMFSQHVLKHDAERAVYANVYAHETYIIHASYVYQR